MNALQAFGNLADTHPHAVKVIFTAICILGVSFAVSFKLWDRRIQQKKRNERLLQSGVQTTITSLDRRRAY